MQGNSQDWGCILIKVWQHIDWVILNVGTKGKLINHQSSVLLPPTTSGMSLILNWNPPINQSVRGAVFAFSLRLNSSFLPLPFFSPVPALLG